MNQGMKICVFCSSSKHLPPKIEDMGYKVGSLIAERKHTLVWGGTKAGLMGIISKASNDNNGYEIGVVPEFLAKQGLTYEGADEILYSKTLSIRKDTLEEISDAYIILPGGFGTLEELSQIMVEKQLKFINKPIVFINTMDYYKPLFEMFENMYIFKTANWEFRKIYKIVDNEFDAIHYIENYDPKLNPIPNKLNLG